jgi:hypothetical protein
MGIAAYNRGTEALRREFDMERRAVEFEIMERLNALAKYTDAGKPCGPIQFVGDRTRGGFWAECPITGFGFWYRHLGEAVRRWRVTIVAFDHGCWKAVPTITIGGNADRSGNRSYQKL